MSTTIRNGLLVLEEKIISADLHIEGDKIAAIAPPGTLPAGGQLIDAGGCLVFPGFIDIHTHLDDRIAGRELADSWESGSRVALQNGITTLGGFVTQRADQPLGQAVEATLARAAGHSWCDYHLHLTPTRFGPKEWEEIAGWIARGFRTFKFYTTYREAGLYTSWDEMEERIGRLHRLGAAILVHAEDEERLERARTANQEWQDPRRHDRLRPAAAEITAIRRLIAIARRTGARLHIVHVSTPEGAAAIHAAADPRISGESCPHYLFLDGGMLARPDGHRWICSPPLRSAAARQRLAQIAAAGEIDMLATDHCAFSRADKDDWHHDLRRVPGGLAGLGALVPLAFRLHQPGGGADAAAAGPLRIARQLAANPARLLGAWPQKGSIRIGSDADLSVIDLQGPSRAIVSSLADAWESFPGMTTTLAIRSLFLRGRLVVRDGRILEGAGPAGRLCHSH